ncbi:hypothetical protein EVAR_12170_1 [Eumeta japonica]|uniref:Uncharacterized protein n=1 Tax=Eumeta variegata TaxID=151549 RepID=A0A4C1UI92_EUMVA|nr:hypothetical protein EVAR_12170_1 [Eumeta japonica]
MVAFSEDICLLYVVYFLLVGFNRIKQRNQNRKQKRENDIENGTGVQDECGDAIRLGKESNTRPALKSTSIDAKEEGTHSMSMLVNLRALTVSGSHKKKVRRECEPPESKVGDQRRPYTAASPGESESSHQCLAGLLAGNNIMEGNWADGTGEQEGDIGTLIHWTKCNSGSCYFTSVFRERVIFPQLS